VGLAGVIEVCKFSQLSGGKMLNQAIKDEIKKYRHYLHQIPETGFEEFKTQSFIKKELVKLGFEVEEVAKTGLIALKSGVEHKAIAFRADMDALAVIEKTNVPFMSTHEGKMHACGHDGHMSIVLGFASYISKLELKKDIVLLFQPAEEGPGGAKIIVDEGYLSKYHVEKIFGLHVFPGIAEGKVGLADGVLMGQAGEFDIMIHAISTHGAMPQNGVDGIVVASQLIQNFQSIISRNIDPIEGAVITIGKIEGGEARNVIAGKVVLNGTIRAFNQDTYEKMKKRMNEITQGLEKMHQIEIKIEIRDLYPPLVNHHHEHLMMLKILNEDEAVILKPMMIAEDFSYYLQALPGYFFMLGTKNESMGYIHPLHSCYFNFDDSILYHGVELYIRICKELKVL